jgi:hypothetical protein
MNNGIITATILAATAAVAITFSGYVSADEPRYGDRPPTEQRYDTPDTGPRYQEPGEDDGEDEQRHEAQTPRHAGPPNCRHDCR